MLGFFASANRGSTLDQTLDRIASWRCRWRCRRRLDHAAVPKRQCDRASLAQFIDDHLVEMISPHATIDKVWFLLGKTQSSRQPAWRIVVFLQHSIRNEWAYGLAVVSARMDRTGEIAVGVCADPKGSISSNGFLAGSTGPQRLV